MAGSESNHKRQAHTLNLKTQSCYTKHGFSLWCVRTPYTFILVKHMRKCTRSATPYTPGYTVPTAPSLTFRGRCPQRGCVAYKGKKFRLFLAIPGWQSVWSANWIGLNQWDNEDHQSLTLCLVSTLMDQDSSCARIIESWLKPRFAHHEPFH